MAIYGTAVLAICVLIGLFIGDLLGSAIGVKANVGGVGFAMRLLIFASEFLRKRDLLPTPTKEACISGAPSTSSWWWPWRPSRTWSPPSRGARQRSWPACWPPLRADGHSLHAVRTF